MLRITKQPIDESTVLLKLEGKLLAPWIEEMQRSLNESATCINLDLSALTFADSAGIQVLSDLIRQGAKVAACSGYVAALLQMEDQRECCGKLRPHREGEAPAEP
jgi:ABC-type transporter Mla MlaB component